MKRLATSKIAAATALLLKQQDYTCPICLGRMGPRAVKTPALDHDHATGYVRDVLCMNCNGIEGKIFNLTRRVGKESTTLDVLSRLIAYYERHKTPQNGGWIHPTHKTQEQKRLLKLAAAKRARLRKKAE